MADTALDRLLARASMDGLTDPAPDRAQLERILSVGLCAPDHGRMRPWRWVVIEGEPRRALADLVGAAGARADAGMDGAKLRRRVRRFARAPLVIALGVELTEGRIPLEEQRLSAACGAMNILNALYLSGFGGIWISGAFCRDSQLLAALGLKKEGHMAELQGFILAGTPDGGKIPPKRRPALADHVSYWQEQ